LGIAGAGRKDAEANIESLMVDKRLFVKWRLGFQVA